MSHLEFLFQLQKKPKYKTLNSSRAPSNIWPPKSQQKTFKPQTQDYIAKDAYINPATLQKAVSWFIDMFNQKIFMYVEVEDTPMR